MGSEDGVVLDDDAIEIVSTDAQETTDDGIEQEVEVGADYIEGLLDIAELDGDIEEDIEGERGMVRVVGSGLDALIGPKGEVLEALQELMRAAVTRETGERSRIMLDVGGYRSDRRDHARAVAESAVARVVESGAAVRCEPMNAYERKVVHDAVAAAGLTSESEGVEPNRFVVVLPA
ncbi:MAG: single-stranded DNA-binding protein [Actinomycetales bacterium]|nr:single-stranded DNA-binding protein [Actinomycetales bacterium]